MSMSIPTPAPTPILATKLYIPPPRPNLVNRPRLIERLNHGLQLGHKLTLISAPAGFGKTTLAAAWLAGCGRPAAWLSLDEADREPARFLTYFVTALQSVAADLGEGTLAALQSPPLPPLESLLTGLLNDLAAMPEPLLLALDDYHVLDAPPVDAVLSFLLDHLPPQMHLVITTREDPPLHLARLRVRGQLTELRAADLRFTRDEAAAFLKQVMDLDLPPEAVDALETRTEGWIAGLQMAALSMQGRADTTGFVEAFAGSNRFVLDYLLEEVLRRQPADLRRFLLQTAILERLSGSLCTAVTGREDGQAVLETLERDNLFVIPLDDQRQWYRYHHLFADVLRSRLAVEQPEAVPALHRRASQWYERHDSPPDAVHHALAAADWERVAALAERAWPAMDWSYQTATWRKWVDALPAEMVRARPVLVAGYAWALLNEGEMEAGAARLDEAEQWLDPAAGRGEPVVVDEAQWQALPITVANARAYHAQTVGDMPGTIRYTRQVLDLLPEDDHLRRVVPTSLLGIAYWASGDLEAAYQTFSDSMENMRLAGNILDAIGPTFILADIRAAQGRLRAAIARYEQSLRLAVAQDAPVQGTASLYLGLAELHLEQGDMEAAAELLHKSQVLGEQAALPDWPQRFRLAQARVKQIAGDLEGALERLDAAERHYFRSPLPVLRPVSALRVRLWLAQGRLAEALTWARDHDLSPDDALTYLREFEHMTLARLLVAQYGSDQDEQALDQAVKLLARLLQAAEAGGRMGSAIEILVLQALAHQARRDGAAALIPLQKALTLAEPEGYARVFADEGPPMAILLREAARRGIAAAYVNSLLSVMGDVGETTPAAQPLPDPLTERELEVLRLLATNLTGPEIAGELMVSLNTMRTHTKNIYSKLGVGSRREAVSRAAALNLL